MLLVLMQAVLCRVDSYKVRAACMLGVLGAFLGLSGAVAGVVALPFGMAGVYWEAFRYLWAAAAAVFGYWLFVPAGIILRTANALKDVQDRAVAAIAAIDKNTPEV